jgi:microcystin-dependent protein
MTADTFSSTIGVLLMGTGNDNNSWGANANSAVFQIFEDAIANALTSSITGGTLDLSGTPPPAAASQARYAALIFNGALGSNQIVKVPNLTKWWWVNNATSGAFTLTMKTPSGASVLIPQNSGWQLVQCDGADAIVVSPFNSQQVQMPDGSAAAPAYSNVNETGTGWYRNGTQDYRLSINGSDVLQVTGPGASAPSIVNILAPNQLQQAGVALIPPGTVLPYDGVALPAGFLWRNGQIVSRATYPNLLAALRAAFTGTVALGVNTITSIPVDLRNLGLEGAVLEGTGVNALTITSIAATSMALSGNATSSGSAQSFLAYPYGNGDGATTFQLGDGKGRTLAGRDNMGVAGSAAAGRLTTAGAGINGIALNASGGSQTVTLVTAQLAAHVHSNVGLSVGIAVGTSINDPGHQHNAVAIYASGGGSSGFSGFNNSGNGGSVINVATNTALTGISANSSASGTLSGSTASAGSDQAHQNTQPTSVTNFIIKF